MAGSQMSRKNGKRPAKGTTSKSKKPAARKLYGK